MRKVEIHLYNKEEKRLMAYKKAHDDIDIPEQSIDQKILSGLQKAKETNKRHLRKNWLISVAAVALILVGFVSSLTIFEYIKDNKGLMDAIDNDYYEALNLSSETKDGVTFTIDGVIKDESGIVIFYTLDSTETRDRLQLDDVHLKDHHGNPLEATMWTFGNFTSDENGKSFSGMIEYFFKEPLTIKDFQLDAEIVGSPYDGTIDSAFAGTFNMAFTLSEETPDKKVYVLDETVTIDGQKMTFTEVTIEPLRTSVHVKMDPNNTKKILGFDDMNINDERGETWTRNTIGPSAEKISDDEHIIHLQSNYFREPEELYLSLNHIQAIDKDEAFIIVDIDKQEIIKQPKGEFQMALKTDPGTLIFIYPKQDIFEPFYGVSLGEITDQEGNIIGSNGSYSRIESDESGMQEYGILLNKKLSNLNGPLSLEIYSYPKWIHGDINIRIK